MRINKKLDFDSCSEEDIPRSSSPDPVDLRKKLLIFDDSEEDFDLSDAMSSPMKIEENTDNTVTPLKPAINETPLLELQDFNMSGVVESNSDKFSPCRTRSGKIYKSVEKCKGEKEGDKSVIIEGTSSHTYSTSKLPTPVFLDRPPRSSSRHCSGGSVGTATPRSTHIKTSHLRVQEVELNLLQKDFLNDMELDEDEPAYNEPPPLITKRPMSRLNISVDTPRHIYGNNESASNSSPWLLKTPANLHSPPTNEVKAMKLFDKSPFYGSSPIAPTTAPRYARGIKFRHLMGADNNGDHSRRFSGPAGLRVSFGQPETETSGKERKRKRVANINPFTPNSMLESLKKKYCSLPEM